MLILRPHFDFFTVDTNADEESGKESFLLFVLIAAAVLFIFLLTFALILACRRYTNAKHHRRNADERNAVALDNAGKELVTWSC